MPDGTHETPTYRAVGADRYLDDGAAETSAPDGWIAAAVAAPTVAKLEELARSAQRSGQWADRDTAWCRALRAALGDNDRAAIKLLVAELGAVAITEKIRPGGRTAATNGRVTS